MAAAQVALTSILLKAFTGLRDTHFKLEAKLYAQKKKLEVARDKVKVAEVQLLLDAAITAASLYFVELKLFGAGITGVLAFGGQNAIDYLDGEFSPTMKGEANNLLSDFGSASKRVTKRQGGYIAALTTFYTTKLDLEAVQTAKKAGRGSNQGGQGHRDRSQGLRPDNDIGSERRRSC